MTETDNTQLASSLGWVRDEINKSLEEARVSLEAYVEDNEAGDDSSLIQCKELINQVKGTLQMVQLQGALLMTEEMLNLIDALLENSDSIEDKNVAYEALMRSILQLPDYFAKVHSGKKDAAVILLPLINDLREAHGETAVVAEALFSPNFDGILPPEMPGVEEFEEGDLAVLIKKTRQQVHLAMLGLFRGKNVEQSLEKLISLYEQYCVNAMSEPIKQLYWVASALSEGIKDGGIDVDALPVKPLLGQIDRQSKIMIDNGEEMLASEPPSELIRILLYYVACTTSEGDRVSQVKDAFSLGHYLPKEEELEKFRNELAGPSAEVIETVVQGITQELDRARDMLDIYIRTGESDTEKLQQMVQSLRNAAGTVAMVGDLELQSSMNEYCDNIDALIAGNKTAEEAGLHNLADFMLQFDVKLQSHRSSGGGSSSSLVGSTGVWNLRKAVVGESSTNMSKVKDIVAGFAESPDSRREDLPTATGLLQQIAGSLKIAQLDRASDAIYALRSCIDQELVAEGKTLGEQEMESLAEAVSSIDYYLEAVADDLPNKDTALDMAEAALDLLGFGTGGDVENELEQLAEQQETDESDESETMLVEEDSVALESLAEELESTYSDDDDVDDSTEYEIDAEAEDAAAEEDFELNEEQLASAVTEVEDEAAAEVEEIEVAPPQETEEEMQERLAAEAEDDFGELPVIEMDESEEPEIEEVSVDAPEETEEEMLARIQEDLETTGMDHPIVSNIEVDDVDSEIEDVDIESAAEDDLEAVEAVEAVDDAMDEQDEPDIQQVPDTLMSESPLGDDLDDEIVEIFLEEAEEVLGELRENFPKWRDNPADVDSLTVVRRSFHTLKGSGRMVGANQIGEFSWSIENLLNKVIDNSVEANTNVMNAIGDAIEVLPAMVGQLQGGPPPEADVAQMSGVADALAAGENPAELHQESKEEPQKKIENSAPVLNDEDLSAQSGAFEASDITSPLQESEELRNVYTEETEQHLKGLRVFLDKCKADSESCRFGEQEILILHTLHGGAATVGAVELKKIFDVLEPLAILFNDHDVRLDDHMLEMLEGVTEQVKSFLNQINDGDESFALDVELLESLQLLFQQKKDLLGAVTGSISILNIVPEDEAVAEDESADDDSTLDEISNSLEDLHDLMSSEIEISDIELESVEEAEPQITTEASDETGSLIDDDHFDESLPVMDAEEEEAQEVEAVDPEIMDIFLEEAVELLESIEQSLDGWQNEVDNHDLMVSVQRDIHTLKGGARMVNQSAIADTGHAMESLLTAVVDGAVDVSDAMFNVLHEARDSLQDQYEELKGGNFNVKSNTPLIAKLEALRAGKVPEETTHTQPPVEDIQQEEIQQQDTQVLEVQEDDDGDSFDEMSSGFELVEIFMEEAEELLESVDTTLDEWQNDSSNMELVIKLQRDIHTLKGGARMVNLSGLGDLGHALENLLTAIVDGHVEFSRPLLDGMHEVKDELQTMYEKVKQGGGDSDVNANMLNLLEALRKGGQVPAEPIGGPDSSSEDMTPSHMLPALEDSGNFGELTPSDAMKALEDTGSFSELTPSDAMAALDDSGSIDITPSESMQALEDSSTLTKLVASAEKQAADSKEAKKKADQRTQPRVEHETIRVRSDLIDGLVNLAGETNIFRSRLEQQSSTFRFSLNELDQTVVRLQEQLKKLQAETDEQILFRHENELDIPEHEDFDPLEMDRYSTMQQLSRGLVESVGDLKSLQDILGGLTRDSETLLLQQGRVNTELQDRLMQARVVPFAATMASRLRRITRQTCQQLGKQAELKIQGANEEMDRHVLDRMVAPLEHMLRNSIAHGIESPEVRKQRGKPESGTITVSVSREGGEIVIQVADDGAGLNTDSIRKKAESKGIIVENADITDEEVMQLVLTPGFSTAESVSQIAGRGVGMDVVNNEIRQLNGSLHIESVPERGAAMTVRLPFTLSITQALLVRVGVDLYAIPLTSIEGVSRIERDTAEDLISDKDKQFQYGGNDYHVSSLSRLLGRHASADFEDIRPAIILVKVAGHRVGFYIDELMGHHEIVVKSLGAQVSSVSGMAGGTILGDGRVALILDVPALVRMVGAEHGLSETKQVQAIEEPKSVKVTVMVVDDSITVRRVTTRLLERHDMDVVTAKDGVDAVAKLEETVPDVMLLDVEMPRMDGYELATHMRNDTRYRNVPIVMITSRTGAKHRERAETIGVDRYLGKPYQELDLLSNINEVLEERREE